MSELPVGITAAPDPFVLRAHHMHNLHILLRRDIEPWLLAQIARQWVNTDEIHPELPHGYYADVYGYDAATALRVERLHTRFYTSFVKLRDENPVQIVTGQPDDICLSCHIGDHCRPARGTLRNTPKSDLGFIRAFVMTALQRGLSDLVIESVQTVQYSDIGPRQVPSLSTTAGTAKTIIGDIRFLEPTMNTRGIWVDTGA